ncbi:MAG: hypothetical protein KDB33_20000 [Acidimicrobiales bacterium]|nr:hypothetical protein [Acidimicrobiales bacterium]
MRVLLLETSPGVATEVSAELEAAGHAVERCHDAGDDAFACNGLLEGHNCPLEEGIDVAVALTDGATADGVRCTLRRHVPLVIGDDEDVPFAEFATARAGGSLLDALDAAVATPLARHGAAALRSERSVLEMHGYDSTAATATVVRNGTTDLLVHLDPGIVVSKQVADILSVRVVGAVRDIDPYARIIDVSVQDADHSPINA